MPAQNDVEMQYQAAAPMDAARAPADNASAQQEVRSLTVVPNDTWKSSHA